MQGEKETEWIPDYETLYKFLFNALTDVTQSIPPGQVVEYQELRVIAQIQELQSQSEELFIETSRAATGVVELPWWYLSMLQT